MIGRNMIAADYSVPVKPLLVNIEFRRAARR